MNAPKLAPDVNRFVYVRQLPYKIESEKLFNIFGMYGAIRQIRLGNTKATNGTAFVVYEDILDAKNAVEHLNGFNIGGRYITVSYHKVDKMKQTLYEKRNAAAKSKQLDAIESKYAMKTT